MQVPKWTCVDGHLEAQFDGGGVRITAQRDGAEIRTSGLPGSDFTFFEWTQYNITSDAVPIARIVGVPAVNLRGSSNAWTLQFQNQVGRARFAVILADGEQLSCHVEVLSRKFHTEEKHEAFLSGLLDDLGRLALHATIDVDAPTSFGGESDPRPPTPLTDYHVLRKWAGRVQEAIETVTSSPHRTLVEEDRERPIWRVTAVTSGLVAQLVERPDRYVRTGVDWPAARLLKGHLPSTVTLAEAEETLHTPENRFVAHWMTAMLEALARMRATVWLWRRVPDETARDLADLEASITFARQSTFLGELADDKPVPFGSQVLARRGGYREAFTCYQELMAARRGVFAEVESLVANRDVATLYELWCFFKLVERLEPVLGRVRRFKHVDDPEFGVRHRAIAEFPGSAHLHYNRGFGHPNSYSVGLRPDYTLTIDGGRRVAFDAKFRFELPPKPASLENPVDGGGDEPVSGERSVVYEDLYKMHAYRDALSLDAAVVVYPGDKDLFFHKPSADGAAAIADVVDLERLIEERWQGVGAVKLAP